MMIYAVLEIIGAITNKKIVDDVKEDKKEANALVEKEDTKKTKKSKTKGKVKEAKVVEDKSYEK